jgi:hypothetical protein
VKPGWCCPPDSLNDASRSVVVGPPGSPDAKECNAIPFGVPYDLVQHTLTVTIIGRRPTIVVNIVLILSWLGLSGSPDAKERPSLEHKEELRCVIAVIRHGDRTPKQKMKTLVSNDRTLSVNLLRSLGCIVGPEGWLGGRRVSGPNSEPPASPTSPLRVPARSGLKAAFPVPQRPASNQRSSTASFPDCIDACSGD